MRNFLYTIAAILLSPIIVVGAVVYGALYVLQLLFRTINLYLENGMRWIDKNITHNIRWNIYFMEGLLWTGMTRIT